MQCADMGQCRYCRYLDIVTQCHNYRCISSPCNIETAELYKETNQHLAPAEALPSSPPANGLYPNHRVQIAVEAGSWLPLEIIIFIVRPQSIITTISSQSQHCYWAQQRVMGRYGLPIIVLILPIVDQDL